MLEQPEQKPNIECVTGCARDAMLANVSAAAGRLTIAQTLETGPGQGKPRDCLPLNRAGFHEPT